MRGIKEPPKFTFTRQMEDRYASLCIHVEAEFRKKEREHYPGRIM